MSETISIRPATVDDVQIVTNHRRLMFLELGHPDDDNLQQMLAEFPKWVQPKIETGQYLGWLAETQDAKVVGGAGMLVHDCLIKPGDLTGKQGYIGNVYVAPEFRRRGIARQLIGAIQAWSEANKIGKTTLHTTQQARDLYTSLGFELRDNWMECKV